MSLNCAAPYWVTPLENKTEDFAKSVLGSIGFGFVCFRDFFSK